MKCESCLSEWNTARPVENCPFCGASLKKEDIKEEDLSLED